MGFKTKQDLKEGIYHKIYTISFLYVSIYKIANIVYKDLQIWNVLHKTCVYIVW